MTDGTWYFVVATYEVNSAKLFVNGSQTGATDTGVTMTESAAVITLGKRSGGVANYFTGSMQHVFICNQVIAPAKILKLAQIAGLA